MVYSVILLHMHKLAYTSNKYQLINIIISMENHIRKTYLGIIAFWAEFCPFVVHFTTFYAWRERPADATNCSPCVGPSHARNVASEEISYRDALASNYAINVLKLKANVKKYSYISM